MKGLGKLLVLLFTFSAAIASAQQTFQHIIIVVQENRSVDNLFGQSTEAGRNISPNGKFNQPGMGQVTPPLAPSA